MSFKSFKNRALRKVLFKKQQGAVGALYKELKILKFTDILSDVSD